MRKIILTFSVFIFLSFSGTQAFSQNYSADKFTTSVQEDLHEVMMYPNPVLAHNFFVKSETGVITSVEVVNVIGQRVKKIVNQTGVPYSIFVQLPDTEKGIFFVRVTFDDEKSMIRKILVK